MNNSWMYPSTRIGSLHYSLIRCHTYPGNPFVYKCQFCLRDVYNCLPSWIHKSVFIPARIIWKYPHGLNFGTIQRCRKLCWIDLPNLATYHDNTVCIQHFGSVTMELGMITDSWHNYKIPSSIHNTKDNSVITAGQESSQDLFWEGRKSLGLFWIAKTQVHWWCITRCNWHS